MKHTDSETKIHRGRWRRGLLALACGAMLSTAFAQTVNLYSFSTGSGSLDPMSGASTLIGSGQDDAASAVTNIGFSFNYEGTNYTQFSVNSNGGMQLGGTQITAYAMNYNIDSRPTSIQAYGGDGTTASGSITTVLTGSSPNQVRVVQYNVAMDYNPSVANITYQVWLYEGTNKIEFRYGAGAPTGTNSGGIQIAITGANPLNYLNVLSNLSATSSSTAQYTTTNAWPGNGTVLTFSPPAPCTTPAPGNTLASTTSGCAPLSTNLTLQNATPGTGVSYQWQSSPDGSAWSNIGGATNDNYAATGVMATTWYRCNVTCSSGPSTVASTPVQITVSNPAANYYVYSGTQFTETFTTWTNRCSTNDVPTGGYWKNTPAYGPGTWRSSNTSMAESGWGGIGGWNYPQNTWADAPMARFHNKNETPAGTVGTLDFYVNMSAGTGTEKLRFDYINGGDVLDVQVSTNGGSTFSTLATINGPYGSFVAAEYVIGSTSATTVIRIKSTALGGNNNDTGIDNFRIVPAATCAKPTSPAATATAPGTASVSWACSGCTGSYYVKYGPTGFNPANSGTMAGPFAGSPATLSGLANGSYQAYVWQDCGGNGVSENAGPVSFNLVAGDFCANAIDISALGLPADDSSNPLAATTTGAQNDYATSACGSQPGADVVLYHDVAPGATVRFTPQAGGKISIAIGGSCPGTTSLACTAGGYLPLGPNVVAYGPWGDPTFTWTNNGCGTERVYVMLDGANVNMYMWNYAYTPAGGPFCPAVTGLAVNTVNTGTGAGLSWSTTCSGNVIVEYGPAGFTPGTGASAGQGTAVAASGTSTTLSGLTLDQAYDVYVRQNCGGGTFSGNGTAAHFTLHNGDDCSRVIALSGASGTIALNTTGANNDISACIGGNTGGDLIMSYTVQPGYGIYFSSAPQAPYTGQVAITTGNACPGSSYLYCNAGAADYFWVNTGNTAVTVYFIQDGTNDGQTSVDWAYLPACAFSDSDGDGINDCDDDCPNFPGQNGDPCTQNGHPGTIVNCQCAVTCNGNQVVVKIMADNNALDLSWVITDDMNAPIANGQLQLADDNTTVTQTVCVGYTPGPGCYGFKLMDSYGDGIANGGWELRTTGGGLILKDSFSSGSASPANPPATAAYGSVHSFCLPLGSANIETARCGVFNYALGNKIFANKVTGATQYEFEFTDPDAGFV
ncbi:MAG: hypothetical protein JSS84_05300, partial [Bacteroidetes bacterium]|nr:hypothetical protein [Bacteroidota bacterium]